MDLKRRARVIRVVDATRFHLLDLQSSAICKVELSPAPANTGYYHLLCDLAEASVIYEVPKKSNKFKQEYQKASIYLNEQPLQKLYLPEKQVCECTEHNTYEKDEIIECYIMRVQCLELKLFLLKENNFVTFYFSELKLPKVEHSHPKQVWQKAQQYFNDEILGQFVQVKVNGSETYRNELNIHGQILQLHNGLDIKQKIIEDGFAQLSKSCGKYLSEHKMQEYGKMIEKSKQENRGVWKKETKVAKGTNQVIEQKYNEWEQQAKKRTKVFNLGTLEQEIKLIGSELKKNSGSKPDPVKCRILLQAVLTFLEDSINEKSMVILEDFIKIVIAAFVNIQANLSLSANNMDFLKYLSKIIILLTFYVTENERLGNKNKFMAIQLEKVIKVLFRCCFMGNQTFHEKVFNKKKQFQFQKFPFDPAYLSGISSYSEASDYEEGEKTSKNNKAAKKLISAHTKVRVNATLLLSLIFKNHSSIVENYWEICVKSNTLTEDFFAYVQKLKISVEQTKMTMEQKKRIVTLMRTNFGDYSLVLLVFFDQSSKVKMNALNCIINMIQNFEGKKMIDTTEAIYIEKLLKQTKSSFVPKSFIIFSGLRNALYFMLFSLHHEKNILIIVNTFKALTELCQQSTLIDKMDFKEGMGLLMSNYISPVLQFPWEVAELKQLKLLCIGFLGALVSSQKKWEEIQTEYLMSEGDKNINLCLLRALEVSKGQEERVEITKYFMKMVKRYYAAVFFEVSPGKSVWSSMVELYLKQPSQQFTVFVEEVFKSHFDHLTLKKNQKSTSRIITEAIYKGEQQFGPFLAKFLPIYGAIVTNQNYISLMSIITCISYESWSNPSYELAKQFLIYCFNNIQEKCDSEVYPSLETLKTNSLVRIAFMKLLGYISFCQDFQNSEFSTHAIKSLLAYSRSHKSLNSVVKITWGISNWSNIKCFKEGLTETELKQCLDYMIKHSQSDKEKIASNCTRGIGFFLNNIDKQFDLQECRQAIINNLSHPIIKVRINSTKTLRLMASSKLLWENEDKEGNIQGLVTNLEQNILKNNYHLQTETLLLIKDLGNPIKQSHMLKLYSHIIHDLLSHTKMEYELSEIKTLKILRKVVLQQIVKLPEELIKNERAAKQFYQSVESFILDSKEESLRKEAENLKILERGFEKGEEALNAVFNIKKENYDQQKTISTEFTLRGIQYQASDEDISLLTAIKHIGKKMAELDPKWIYLCEMTIIGKTVSLGSI